MRHHRPAPLRAPALVVPAGAKAARRKRASAHFQIMTPDGRQPAAGAESGDARSEAWPEAGAGRKSASAGERQAKAKGAPPVSARMPHRSAKARVARRNSAARRVSRASRKKRQVPHRPLPLFPPEVCSSAPVDARPWMTEARCTYESPVRCETRKE